LLLLLLFIFLNYNYYQRKSLRWHRIKRLQGHLTTPDSVTVQTSVKFHNKESRTYSYLSGSGKLRRHDSVFSIRLKTNSEGADVTSAGKLFHAICANQHAWTVQFKSVIFRVAEVINITTRTTIVSNVVR